MPVAPQYYIAIRTTPEIDQKLEQLRLEIRDRDFLDPDYAEEHHFGELANLFIDLFVQRFAYDMMESIQMSERQEFAFRRLAMFISRAGHGMSGQLVKTFTAEEIRRLIHYFDEHQHQFSGDPDGVSYFAIPLPENIAHDLLEAFSAIEEGRGMEVKEQYHQAMDEMLDIVFTELMDKPAALVDLGPVLRPLVQLTIKSVRKTQKMAMNRSVSTITAEELKQHVSFLKTLIRVESADSGNIHESSGNIQQKSGRKKENRDA